MLKFLSLLFWYGTLNGSNGGSNGSSIAEYILSIIALIISAPIFYFFGFKAGLATAFLIMYAVVFWLVFKNQSPNKQDWVIILLVPVLLLALIFLSFWRFLLVFAISAGIIILAGIISAFTNKTENKNESGAKTNIGDAALYDEDDKHERAQNKLFSETTEGDNIKSYYNDDDTYDNFYMQREDEYHEEYRDDYEDAIQDEWKEHQRENSKIR